MEYNAVYCQGYGAQSRRQHVSAHLFRPTAFPSKPYRPDTLKALNANSTKPYRRIPCRQILLEKLQRLSVRLTTPGAQEPCGSQGVGKLQGAGIFSACTGRFFGFRVCTAFQSEEILSREMKV